MCVVPFVSFWNLVFLLNIFFVRLLLFRSWYFTPFLFLFFSLSTTRQADGPQSSTRTPWAQCDKCLKWRRMPWHTDPAQLGDTWFCWQNTWDVEKASCDVSLRLLQYVDDR